MRPGRSATWPGETRIGADAAQDAEHALDQKRRLDQLAIREVGKRVEVADVVAFELEARAECLPNLPHDPFDIAVVVIHDAAAGTLDIGLLPIVLPAIDAGGGAFTMRYTTVVVTARARPESG